MTAQSGWYPDPGGEPNRLRHWDGQRWSRETAPATQPPPPAPKGPVSRSTEQRRWPITMLALVVLLASVAVFLAWQRSGSSTAGPDTNSAAPTISAWDEKSRPTDAGGRPIACPQLEGRSPGQPEGNRYHGGGISYAAVSGWQNSDGWGVDWASDRAGQMDLVGNNWLAMVSVGAIPREFFPNPKVAARQMMDCEATSFYYHEISGRRDLTSQAVTVDGHKGWELRGQIEVQRDDGILGDQLIILVLDIGDPDHLSFFLSEAPIGDQRRIDLVVEASNSLTVD